MIYDWNHNRNTKKHSISFLLWNLWMTYFFNLNKYKESKYTFIFLISIWIWKYIDYNYLNSVVIYNCYELKMKNLFAYKKNNFWDRWFKSLEDLK